MARKRYTAEEIICHLRTVEIEAGKGLGIADACRKLGITEQTYYRWKIEYGGLRVEQAKRLKGLEQENARLKRLVVDLSLDSGGKLLSPALRREAVRPHPPYSLCNVWLEGGGGRNVLRDTGHPLLRAELPLADEPASHGMARVDPRSLEVAI